MSPFNIRHLASHRVNSVNKFDWFLWERLGRWICFLLASTSIGCLLAEFYGICPMQTAVFFLFLPATICLGLLAGWDHFRGNGQLWRMVLIGFACGLLAAVAYDIFRVPFVFAKDWGITTIVPHLPLFKVFPRFGAMILGQPTEQPAYSGVAQMVGWGYHFSNGATFGVMYLALIGDPRRRSWLWAVVFAVGIEILMLLTPYASAFQIRVTALFVAVTLTAHMIFGCCLGRMGKALV